MTAHRPDPKPDPDLLDRLTRAGVATPLRDCRKLWAWALEASGADPAKAVTDPRALALYETAVEERLTRKPVSQIIGRRAFWEGEFEVTPDVLDPRPETETLVAEALKVPFDTMLDLGTGSGCIAISVMSARPRANGLATDLSPDALAIAKRNCARAELSNLRFQCANWYAGVEGRFDLILSNPPYIRADEMAGLAPEVRDHEPRLALTDEGDGLGAYRVIAAGASAHLTPGGRLMVEVGVGQADDVSRLFSRAGLASVTQHNDLDNRARVVSGIFQGT